jgi:hypothetical protein
LVNILDKSRIIAIVDNIHWQFTESMSSILRFSFTEPCSAQGTEAGYPHERQKFSASFGNTGIQSVVITGKPPLEFPFSINTPELEVAP